MLFLPRFLLRRLFVRHGVLPQWAYARAGAKVALLLFFALMQLPVAAQPAKASGPDDPRLASLYAAHWQRLHRHFVYADWVAPDARGCYARYYGYSLPASSLRAGEQRGRLVPDTLPDGRLSGGLRTGDGMVQLGYYIGVLATDYALRRQRDQATDTTLWYLFCALEAIDRLDRLAEASPPYPEASRSCQENGFFIRSDFAAGMLAKPDAAQCLPGRRLSLTEWDRTDADLDHHCPVGTGRGCENWMSVDQVVHLFVGLALVRRCLPDGPLPLALGKGRGAPAQFNFCERVSRQADRILRYLAQTDYRIKDPVFGQQVRRGPDARFMAHGLQQAGRYICALAQVPQAWQRRAWQQGVAQATFKSSGGAVQAAGRLGIGASFSYAMLMTLAAIGESWETEAGPTPQSLTQERLEKLSRGMDGGLYPLLYAFLHHKTPRRYDREHYRRILLSADAQGPRHFVGPPDAQGLRHESAPPGWRGPNRWYLFIERDGAGHQKPTAPGLYFNGLDFLLLHNLFVLHRPSMAAPATRNPE